MGSGCWSTADRGNDGSDTIERGGSGSAFFVLDLTSDLALKFGVDGGRAEFEFVESL